MATNYTGLISCRNCAHASFMQWFNNPVIAYCDAREERMVADSVHLCNMYVYRNNADREITHYDHYDISQ